MTRIEVLQMIIDRMGAQNYLEIGVGRGHSFLPIKAKRKIAVDPDLRIPANRKRSHIFRNLRSKYYALTSDRFFGEVSLPRGLDVVFVDGLHTYEQALKDVENALKLLNKNGVIVMHDCNPPNASSALPAASYSQAASLKLPGWKGEWCGDAWKSICYLRTQRKDLTVFVLDCDYGLGIVKRGATDDPFELSEEALRALSYNDLEKNRQSLLNLKDELFVHEFLKTF
jgi:hypothetical protein